MDKKDSRVVEVAYVPGRSGSVVLSPFDPALTQEMVDLERKYVDMGLEIFTVGNIDMYGEYLPVLAEAGTVEEFEKLIVEQFGPKKGKTVIEQVKYNADQYIKLKNGEPNSAKVIEVEFLDLVEEVADKNSAALEKLSALGEVEKGNLPTFESVDTLLSDLNDTDSH